LFTQLTSRTLPNSVVTTYSYDRLGRITQIKDAKNNTAICLAASSCNRSSSRDGPGLLRRAGSGLTHSKSALVERESYDGYGNSAGSTKTRHGFTGRER
jgi:YD repeat-containing protein